MIVAVPRETYPGEARVALTPDSVGPLTKAGAEVVVEAGAGTAALALDEEFEAKGARIESDRAKLLGDADVVLYVRGPWV